MLTTEQQYLRLIAGRYADAQLAPPVSGPSVYARLAKLTLDEHGLDPLSDPEQLARAEGLHLAWVPTPGRCAAHGDDGLVLMRWIVDARERGFRITHERAHATLRRHGMSHANETDAMWLTLALACPPSCLDRAESAAFIPLRIIRALRRQAA